jgi:hypothetical protein
MDCVTTSEYADSFPYGRSIRTHWRTRLLRDGIRNS